MSLVGSLEDLGLVELLQIISMSGRQGVVVLRNPEGAEGRIALQDGLVRGALVKGGPEDLRGLLVDAGHVAEDAFAAAAAEAQSTGAEVEAILAERGIIPGERLDSIRRESVEGAVIRLLRWESGEFSFEIREEMEDGDPPLFAPSGISAEYLAMEAARLDDEAGDAVGDEGESVEVDPSCVGSIFAEAPDPSGEDPVPVGIELPSDAGPSPDLVNAALPGAAQSLAKSDDASEAVPSPAALGGAESGTEIATERVVELSLAALLPSSSSSLSPPLHASPGPVVAPASARPPLVVIDSDLSALEWAKESLAELFPRVHIFQRCSLALPRIRHYLAALTPPLVLLSPGVEPDGPGGIPNAAVMLRRLKAQAPRMPVLWFAEAGEPPVKRIAPADGLLTRPAGHQLANPGVEEQNKQSGDQLRVDLLERLARAPAFVDSQIGLSAQASLRFLKNATAGLVDGAPRGEILPVVIQFAAEVFARVAMFLVRDGLAVGLAQSGLDRAGGPTDDALRNVVVAIQESAWLRTVLSGRSSVRSSPMDDGDLELANLLGDRLPAEVFLAPIRSAGQTVAVLYADNLPGSRPIGDTTALEVILHHAGLALDRAALERALADGDDSRPSDSPALAG